MPAKTDDIVRVASRSLTQVETWHELLWAAGIESRIVGDGLAGGLGTALPNSVELWVHRDDAKAAEAMIAGAGDHHYQESGSHPMSPHAHPESDPRPDHSRGPQLGRPPRRPMPSR